MTNKMLDHIEAVILQGQDRQKPVGVLFAQTYHRDDDLRLSADHQTRIRFKLELYFEQYVDFSAPPDYHVMVKERAKAAIARHLYDDVVRDLHRVQEAMWENGDRKTPALDKIDAMIQDLTGQMTRFEP